MNFAVGRLERRDMLSKCLFLGLIKVKSQNKFTMSFNFKAEIKFLCLELFLCNLWMTLFVSIPTYKNNYTYKSKAHFLYKKYFTTSDLPGHFVCVYTYKTNNTYKRSKIYIHTMSVGIRSLRHIFYIKNIWPPLIWLVVNIWWKFAIKKNGNLKLLYQRYAQLKIHLLN